MILTRISEYYSLNWFDFQKFLWKYLSVLEIRLEMLVQTDLIHYIDQVFSLPLAPPHISVDSGCVEIHVKHVIIWNSLNFLKKNCDVPFSGAPLPPPHTHKSSHFTRPHPSPPTSGISYMNNTPLCLNTVSFPHNNTTMRVTRFLSLKVSVFRLIQQFRL